jgi:hypothetical protein
MTAAECWLEVAARCISVVPALDGKLWCASADIKGDRDHNRKRAIRSETVIAATPLLAVEQLVAKLGSQAEQQQLWGEEEDV